MSMMISGGLVVCPGEIVSAASSHPLPYVHAPYRRPDAQFGELVATERLRQGEASEAKRARNTRVWHVHVFLAPLWRIRRPLQQHQDVWVRASLRLPHGDGEGELHGVLTVRILI